MIGDGRLNIWEQLTANSAYLPTSCLHLFQVPTNQLTGKMKSSFLQDPDMDTRTKLTIKRNTDIFTHRLDHLQWKETVSRAARAASNDPAHYRMICWLFPVQPVEENCEKYPLWHVENLVSRTSLSSRVTKHEIWDISAKKKQKTKNDSVAD